MITPAEEFIEYRCPLVIVGPRDTEEHALYVSHCIKAVSEQGFAPVAPCVFLPNDENYIANCTSLVHDLMSAGAFIIVFSDFGVCEGMIKEIVAYESSRDEEMHEVVTTTLKEFSSIFNESESEHPNEQPNEPSNSNEREQSGEP
jgi:hypothetical protein